MIGSDQNRLRDHAAIPCRVAAHQRFKFFDRASGKDLLRVKAKRFFRLPVIFGTYRLAAFTAEQLINIRKIRFRDLRFAHIIPQAAFCVKPAAVNCPRPAGVCAT